MFENPVRSNTDFTSSLRLRTMNFPEPVIICLCVAITTLNPELLIYSRFLQSKIKSTKFLEYLALLKETIIY